MRLTCDEMIQLGLRTAEQCAAAYNTAGWIGSIALVTMVGIVLIMLAMIIKG